MTARNLWITMGLLLVFAIGLIWFFITFERQERLNWVGLKGKAQSDPYYITERFLQTKGLNVKRETTFTQMGAYKNFSGYDTIFFSNKAETLTPPQITLLLDWVESGGKLVLNSKINYELNEKKPLNSTSFTTTKGDNLLRSAGIAVSSCRLNNAGEVDCADRCDKPEPVVEKKSSSKNTANKNTSKSKTSSDKKPLTKDQRIDKLLAISNKDNRAHSVFSVDGQRLQRRWNNYKNDLFAYQGKAKVNWIQPARCSGDLFADFAYGEGHIIVYQEWSDRVFATKNRERANDIFAGHNATYLYYLLNLGKTAKNVLWFERDTYTSAWLIVWQYGYYALMVTLLLVIAWAWKNGKRFGPLIRTNEREALSLKRHLRAMGDFYIKQDKRHVLIASCYEQLDKSIAKGIPMAATLSKNELAELLTEKTQLSRTNIHEVLARRYPEDDATFTQLIYTINEIRKRL